MSALLKSINIHDILEPEPPAAPDAIQAFREYLLKRRETLLIELAFIETSLGLPRTKEPRKQ